jgi:hypothetical protein
MWDRRIVYAQLACGGFAALLWQFGGEGHAHLGWWGAAAVVGLAFAQREVVERRWRGVVEQAQSVWWAEYRAEVARMVRESGLDRTVAVFYAREVLLPEWPATRAEAVMFMRDRGAVLSEEFLRQAYVADAAEGPRRLRNLPVFRG